MSDPSRPRPVPGPPGERAAPPAPAAPAPAASDVPAPGPQGNDGGIDPARATPFRDLDQRPVADHVDVFEAEHARLERELRTIDQL